jgi:hypothetical protein
MLPFVLFLLVMAALCTVLFLAAFVVARKADDAEMRGPKL